MKYSKTSGVSGKWVKASELTNGVRAKIIAETIPTPSQFENKDGSQKMQDVTKIRFENVPEAMNINLNRATLNGLIDAFGDDSKNWINKYLTVHTEKVMVGGKRVTALYLIPEGFEVTENAEGYIEIRKVGEKKETAPMEPIPVVNYPDEPNPEDIPF